MAPKFQGVEVMEGERKFLLMYVASKQDTSQLLIRVSKRLKKGKSQLGVAVLPWEEMVRRGVEVVS